MTTTFAHLGLPDPLVRALTSRDMAEPFPVQTATIPDALAGRDVCGKAPTGSGKTLAFGLPLLARVGEARPFQPRSLILAPTRELAEQIKRELHPLAREMRRQVFAVYGGVGYGPQKNALRKGVNVLVATPGRLEDLIQQKSVDLSQVEIVVVDEADRMADMGFLPAVRRILDRTPADRQTLLFSATLDGDVTVLSRDYQRHPVRHEAAAVEPATTEARHHFWLVDHHDRVQHLVDFVDVAGKSIVFTRTRYRADRLAKQVTKLGVGAVALHGGRSQNQRTRALQAFSTGRARVLVATDVAARGIHVDDVASVVHFDPPADAKAYLHRSGRTARAGAAGTIVSLVSRDQVRAVRRMQHDLDLQGPIEVPRFDTVGPDDRVAGQNRPEPPRQARGNDKAPSESKQRARREMSGPQSIYVANLPWATSEADLETLFARHGEVHQTTIITDRRTGRSKGFGFVDMSPVAARDAIAALHEATLSGRRLTVRLARPRRFGA
jgi:superfamily II DNA/RNA helicase